MAAVASAARDRETGRIVAPPPPCPERAGGPRPAALGRVAAGTVAGAACRLTHPARLAILLTAKLVMRTSLPGGPAHRGRRRANRARSWPVSDLKLTHASVLSGPDAAAEVEVCPFPFLLRRRKVRLPAAPGRAGAWPAGCSPWPCPARPCWLPAAASNRRRPRWYARWLLQVRGCGQHRAVVFRRGAAARGVAPGLPRGRQDRARTVDAGATVHRGQPLARLDVTDLGSAEAGARAVRCGQDRPRPGRVRHEALRRAVRQGLYQRGRAAPPPRHPGRRRVQAAPGPGQPAQPKPTRPATACCMPMPTAWSPPSMPKSGRWSAPDSR